MAGRPPVREVVVGRIGRAHGIRGEVSIDVRTDEPERRFATGAVLRPAPSSRPRLTVDSARPHGQRLLVRFREVADRTTAESLLGADLLVDLEPGDRPADPDDFYDHELVGLRVALPDGREVGTVTDVLHRPVQDLLSVALDEADGRTALVPFVADLVPEVDLDGGRLVVSDVQGLLDGED